VSLTNRDLSNLLKVFPFLVSTSWCRWRIETDNNSKFPRKQLKVFISWCRWRIETLSLQIFPPQLLRIYFLVSLTNRDFYIRLPGDKLSPFWYLFPGVVDESRLILWFCFNLETLESIYFLVSLTNRDQTGQSSRRHRSMYLFPGVVDESRRYAMGRSTCLGLQYLFPGVVDESRLQK